MSDQGFRRVSDIMCGDEAKKWMLDLGLVSVLEPSLNREDGDVVFFSTRFPRFVAVGAYGPKLYVLLLLDPDGITEEESLRRMKLVVADMMGPDSSVMEYTKVIDIPKPSTN